MHSIITNTKKIVSLALCLILLIIGTNFGITKAEDSQTNDSQTNDSQTDDSQTGDSKKGYELRVSYDVTDNSISESNYFSYTTDGSSWTRITGNGPYENVLAIKLTLDQNHSLATHTSIGSVDNNHTFTPLDMSKIMNNLTADNGFTLAGDNIDRFEINNIGFFNNSSSGENNNDNNNQQVDHSFKGTIYLTWIANNKFYYHKISGLITNDPTTLQTKSIAEMKADNDNSVLFEIGNSYEFCYESFGGLIDTNDTTGNTYTNSDFNSATANQKLSMLRELDLTIDPTGAVSTSNSISTNGDRAFRLAIYTENCKAFTISGSGNYTINAEDQILTNSTVDLSDSTVSNPAEVNSFILNDTVNIVANNIGSTATSIDSIEAVNVANSNAITINNTTRQVTFNSNFYNNVTFKITDTNNKAYYVKVNRYDMLISDSLVPDDTNNRIYSNVYYSKSLVGNVAVQVRIVKNDGSVEITNATLSSTTHLPNGDVVEQNYVDGSTGRETITSDILMSTFYIDKTNVKDAYFTVINKTNNTILSGSGYGLHYSVAQRKTIY
ncbi:hypothetical protein [Lachnospira multipara]|uniref:hypothetical protein n=1 Tax=Lachnospira multipara TaxID=28051 RepID=UPI0004E18878|nr:hypothetical protein [Lachnospira multipara]